MPDETTKWKRVVRASGLVEWVCEHGVGHPDQNSVEALGNAIYAVHGCDGCCGRSDFPGRKQPKPAGILGVIKNEADRLMNPLKYETEVERQERHRKENMDHQLKLEKIRRTKFVETNAAGNSQVSINDNMAREFGWMRGGETPDPLDSVFGSQRDDTNTQKNYKSRRGRSKQRSKKERFPR